MRNLISYSALTAALASGTTVAHAQTVDTVIAPQPAPVVIAPAAAPVETVETVRKVRSTTVPRRHIARGDRVTKTRTTVSAARAGGITAGQSFSPPASRAGSMRRWCYNAYKDREALK